MIYLPESKGSVAPIVGQRYRIYSWELVQDNPNDAKRAFYKRKQLLRTDKVTRVVALSHLNPVMFSCELSARYKEEWEICSLDMVKE
jgi:hypothetical protein